MRSTQSMVALLTVVALVLAGCGGEGVASGTPLPTVVLGRAGAPTAAQAQPRRGGVTASAVVAPVEQLALTAGVAGRIAEVRVVEGERVTAGQVLVALDDGAAQAQVAEAEAALAAAQAELDLLTAGPTPEELRQAEAAVASAQAALAALQAGARAEQVAQAEANLVAAQAALALLQRDATDLAAGRPDALEEAEARGPPEQAVAPVRERRVRAEGGVGSGARSGETGWRSYARDRAETCPGRRRCARGLPG